MLSAFPPASVNVGLALFFWRYLMTPSLDFTGLDPFDGILARSSVEGARPGRDSK
jgi:flagellar biosynthesis protein FliP